MSKNKYTEISNPTNDAESLINMSKPYSVKVVIEGTADLLFHRWSCDDVAEKSAARKNSKQKKTDNLEAYIYRNEEGYICLPSEYIRQPILETAKYFQDPRSPRKSLKDLSKAALIVLTPLASLGKKEWDYEDRRRVVIQKNAITRIRPAFKAGWRAEHVIQCLLPEYIGSQLLNEIISMAGKISGTGDFRPTFGRFQIISYEVLEE